MNPFIALVVTAVKAYVAQVATREIAYRVLLAVAEAVARNTETDLDDKSVEVVRELLGLPARDRDEPRG